MTQAEIILRYLRDARGGWTPAFKLRSVDTPYGWLGHQGDRTCRKLAAEGRIERHIINRYVHYRFKEQIARKSWDCPRCQTHNGSLDERCMVCYLNRVPPEQTKRIEQVEVKIRPANLFSK